ncbi:radical SAM protein [Sphingomonas sp. RT2P30]|uniref:radical SAM protein n=1 Tax=Parasphingomonas halimpatiens TaxID=3096162 RepID=UPI002FCBF570
MIVPALEERQAFVAALARASSAIPDKPALSEWAGLAANLSQFDSRPSWSANPARLRYLAIDTTASCNLTCPQMCYYHPALGARRERAELERFDEAIRVAARDLDLGVLAFAGKEPLVDAGRLVALAEQASRVPDRRFSIGIVTNGTLVRRNGPSLDRLVRAGALDFIDVSIDSSSADQHDAIRGKAGALKAAQAALSEMLDSWPHVRIGMTSVLRRDNGESIADLVARADPRLRNFFVFPFQPPVFDAQLPAADWSAIDSCVARIVDVLERGRRDAGIEVTISLLGLHLADAVRSGRLRLDSLREDDNGQIFVQQEIGGNTLTFVAQVLPDTGRYGLRILPDGTVLPSTHYLQVPEPLRFGIGSIAEESIVDLYAKAIGPGSAIDQLWASRLNHACRDRPCWPLCFGGIAISDNNIISGKPLDLPPDLCLSSGAESAEALRGDVKP